MALSSTTTRWDYTGDGSTTDFSYNNKIFEDSDLEVYVDGSQKTLNTNYTVTGAGTDAGGEVKFTSAPANNAEVVIIRSVTNTQESDYPAGGPLSSSTLEDDLDRRTIVDQQQDETFGRSLRIPKSDQGSPTTELPVKADRASKFLKFDSDGNVSTSSSVSLDDADLLTGTDTGSANTYVVSTSASLSSLTDGQILVFRPQTAPTGASTLNVDSTSAKSLVRSDGSAVQSGDFAVDQHLVCNYDANADEWVATNLPGNVIRNKGTAIPEIRSDTKANRPAAGTEGRWFYATDENRLYRDDGSSWGRLYFAQEQRVELGNEFSPGAEVVCVRYGNVVTISSDGALSHGSFSNPVSSTGVIPADFRPSSDDTGVMYAFDAGAIMKVQVDSNGTLATSYVDHSGTAATRTGTGQPFSLTYVITANVT